MSEKVFLVTIEPTGEIYKLTNHKSRNKKPPLQVKISDCPKCNGVMMNGICTSTCARDPSQRKPSNNLPKRKL